jgi:hypothetical protein
MMRVSARLVSCTADAQAAAQAVDAVAAEFARAADGASGLESFRELSIGLTIANPLGSAAKVRGSGHFDAQTDTFYASAPLDYAAWVDTTWSARVAAVVEGLTLAVRAIHKTRLAPGERELLLALVRRAAHAAGAAPPEAMAELRSVFLLYYPGIPDPAVAFDAPPVGAGPRAVELKPSEALAAAAAKSPPAPRPEMFKLYRKEGRDLRYHEAWLADGEVMEHWGRCGERGETRRHPVANDGQAVAVLARLRAEATARGFRPMAQSRHRLLIVERAIDGFGSPDDLDRRHRLEEFLNETLGWTGLGHCDGGTIGSGSMEAACLVADGPAALAVIQAALAPSPFSDFTAKIAR